jgi:hypothetical protein
MMGKSFFEHASIRFSLTKRALAFMKSLGIHFDMPNEKQIQQAEKTAALIPAYPNPDCVKRMQDFIVVRISETLYGNDGEELKMMP